MTTLWLALVKLSSWISRVINCHQTQIIFIIFRINGVLFHFCTNVGFLAFNNLLIHECNECKAMLFIDLFSNCLEYVYGRILYTLDVVCKYLFAVQFLLCYITIDEFSFMLNI